VGGDQSAGATAAPAPQGGQGSPGAAGAASHIGRRPSRPATRTGASAAPKRRPARPKGSLTAGALDFDRPIELPENCVRRLQVEGRPTWGGSPSAACPGAGCRGGVGWFTRSRRWEWRAIGKRG